MRHHEANRALSLRRILAGNHHSRMLYPIADIGEGDFLLEVFLGGSNHRVSRIDRFISQFGDDIARL